LVSVAAGLLEFGPPGVFLLAALDSGGLPIPVGVDALVVALAASNPRAGLWSALLATLGSALGCLFLFQVGRTGGEACLGRRVHNHSRLPRFRRWFARYGLLTVFVPVLVPAPLPTKVFVLLAGALNASRIAFLLVVLAGRLLRYSLLAWLAWQLRTGYAQLVRDHGWLLLLAAFALFLLLAGLLRLFFWQRERVRMANAGHVSGDPSRIP